MLRWLALAALVVASCVSAADAQQRDSSKDFTLVTSSSHGIWSDGSTMYVLQSGSPIHAYHMSNQQRASSQDSSWLSDAADPVGIWSFGSTLYLTDNINDKILAYHLSNKSRDSSNDFNTLSTAGNNGPAGIWSNSNTMWVADHDDDKLYAYHMSSKSRDSSKDITLASGNGLPWGIWSDGTTMWVADINAFKIYAYNISGKSHDSSKDITLASGHRSLDIWSDSTTMWVLDFTHAKIYAYSMPSGGVGGQVGPVGGSSPTFFVPPPPRDTTPPTVLSVERVGNATTTDRALTWNVTFSEPVVVSADARINHTSVVNATIPDLGAVHDTVFVDIPGLVAGGSVSVDLSHPIASGLLIELVSPDCTRLVLHNQTTTFLYKLQQPRDLGDLAGVGAAGQWTLHVSDHAEHWNGTLNDWSLELESGGAVEGSGDTYAITRHVAGPGSYAFSLDGYEVRDRAGNSLADAGTVVGEPYRVVGAAARTCQTG